MSVGPLAPGALFANDYEIVRSLKTGGMGTVYVALQKSTGKQRALKLMLPDLVEDPELRRRFDQEARIASLIDSDHIVEVVAAGIDEASSAPWLAMELLEGTDLEQAVEKRGFMSLDEARVVLKELCHAVAAAHAAGIVHRDLKPENVFLAESKSTREGRVVKVLDFGIAKIAAEARTRHTAALGSPIWMAPEQTERGAVTPSADVWAIGLIGFYLLTGRCFWLSADASDGTVQQVMREVLFAKVPAASLRARQYGVEGLLPPWFDAWFELCVVREPGGRFQNAAKAFAAFDRSCGTPSERRPVGLTYPSNPESLRSSEREQNSMVPSNPVSSPNFAAVSSATVASAPTLFAGVDARENPFSTHEVPSRWSVRPSIWIAALAIMGMSYVTYNYLRKLPDGPSAIAHVEPTALPHVRGTTFAFPPDLVKTHGAQWFHRYRTSCNPVEIELVMQKSPPPPGKDGAGFAAACFTLAGKLDRARKVLDALPPDDRPFGAWAVFEVIHPIADGGDDASAGPAMRLILEYWPSNYMALYHAGMSEYFLNDPAEARMHLGAFLTIYKKADGFTAAAKRALTELDRASADSVDCSKPLAVDPEGRQIFPLGCPK